MAGRPPKPLALKALEGDTRQRGKHKFAAAIAATGVMAKRGIPDKPEWLEVAEEEHLRVASQFWDQTARQLHGEGLLAAVDEGMLTSISLVYAEMVMAGRNRDKGFLDAVQRFMQAADRMGLNESSRSKFTKPKEDEGDAGIDAMSRFLEVAAPAGKESLC